MSLVEFNAPEWSKNWKRNFKKNTTDPQNWVKL